MSNKILEHESGKVLISMSIPISLGMLSTFLFQVIDTYFVGQLGANELAALSFASTVYFMVVGAFLGLAVGVSILVGKYAGSNQDFQLREVFFIGAILSIVLAIILSGILIKGHDTIFLFLGASANLLPYIKEYMVVILIGMPLLTFGMMAGANLRAKGNIVMPDVIMGIAGVINLLLDYALIFGHLGFDAYGIKGAGLATAGSWVFVAIAMFYFLVKDGIIKKDSFKAIQKFIQYTKQIFSLGAPVIVTQVIQPFTLMFITYLLASQSEFAVAAYGVAGRIEMLLMIGISGVSMAITPFIAQNFGARNKERIDEAIVFGGKSSVYIGLLICIVLMTFAKPIAGIFTNDPIIVGDIVTYFYWVAPSFIFYGLFLVTSSILNGLQQSKKSLRIMLIKTLLFTVPLAIVGSTWGVEGIFIGVSLSNVLGGIYASIVMKKDLEKAKSVLTETSAFQEYKNDLVGVFRK
ncbi:MATE family efflux transporter [Flammeovirga kamogawensis]|uniref:Multidrug-efflux transporter n=1 Tax=Flammeovirga kamogawensis TaxID=373891 RepID=A0ABX8H110_9BACT|nr:MATE family efflux transporter [Flammeovirga kamogawensis]MBB6462221.1 putative MATE family efflux protein [Flammeovirga kamogawensis]QWG09378.1 MATE family efflux transporter [Flammeovirga kamogawensis]TRX64896.1 MATE family efflux transporter [Flammeovirga kamogawensis]